MTMFRRAGSRLMLSTTVLLFGTLALEPILIGASIFTTGVLLHVWAAGCLTRGSRLVSWGPYAVIRHPLYMGNFLMDSGIVAAGGHPLFLAYFILFFLAYRHTLRREHADLLSLFGEEYQRYKARVPAFFPFRRPLWKDLFTGFHFKNLRRNKEMTRIIRYPAYPLLALLRRAILLQGPSILYTPFFLYAASAVVLLLGSSALERFLRKRRTMGFNPLRLAKACAPGLALIGAAVWHGTRPYSTGELRAGETFCKGSLLIEAVRDSQVILRNRSRRDLKAEYRVISIDRPDALWSPLHIEAQGEAIVVAPTVKEGGVRLIFREIP